MIALGTFEEFVLVMVYTMRGERVRIISARRANEEERNVYYGYLVRGTTEDPWSDEAVSVELSSYFMKNHQLFTLVVFT